jgi:hypothetical protein
MGPTYSANPISASKTKENTQKPVTWNKARVKVISTIGWRLDVTGATVRQTMLRNNITN